MAIHEHDREDLIRDGHTMTFRGELDADGVTVLVGFRPQGQLSLYIGADPVFQFNSHGQLRRVYFQGRRFSAERGNLVELIRDSVGGKVQLNRRQIDEDTLSLLRSSALNWIEKIGKRIGNPDSLARVTGEESIPFRERVTRWIDEHGQSLTIADSPNV